LKYLIAGLGNIGTEYENTRHNVGFIVADAIVKDLKGSFKVERLASVSKVKYKGRTLVVIKPTTYMNRSGRSVKYWLDKEKIPLERLLVIVDDIALPLGAIRLKPKGGDGGHNGILPGCGWVSAMISPKVSRRTMSSASGPAKRSTS